MSRVYGRTAPELTSARACPLAQRVVLSDRSKASIPTRPFAIILGLLLSGTAAQATESAELYGASEAPESEEATRYRVRRLAKQVSVGVADEVALTQGVEVGLGASTGFNSSSVAVGWGASARAPLATAVGSDAVANATGAAAFGYGAHASVHALAAGNRAQAANYSVALGAGATAFHTNSVALGYLSDSAVDNSVSIGSASNKRRLMNVARGLDTTDAATFGQLSETNVRLAAINDLVGGIEPSLGSVALGRGASVRSNATNGVAIGADATASGGEGVISIGSHSEAYGVRSLAVGNNALVGNSESMALGANTSVFGNGNAAIGNNARVLGGNQVVALGANSVASGDLNVSIGDASKKLYRRLVNVANGVNANDAVNVTQLKATNDQVAQIVNRTNYVAVGTGPVLAAKASGAGSTAVGNGAVAETGGSALGDHAHASLDSVVVGRSANATFGNSIAIGADAGAFTGSDTIAVGSKASANNTGSIALGGGAVATNVHAMALGYGASTAADGGVAIGSSAKATHSGAVALGENSVTAVANSLSIGSASLKRRIMYVAPGTDGNDAVNLDQLRATDRKVDGHTASLAGQDLLLKSHASALVAHDTQIGSLLDAGANARYLSLSDSPDTDAMASGAGALALGGAASAANAGALAIGSESLAAGTFAISLGSSANASGDGSVAIGHNAVVDKTAIGAVALGAGSAAAMSNTVSIGNSAGGLFRRLVNVADGMDANDAVTVTQLTATNDQVAKIVNRVDYVAVGTGAVSAAQATGAGSTAVGNGALAEAGSAALGENAHASADSVVVGRNASATFESSVAIGAGAGTSAGIDTVAVGARASATDKGSTALGGGAVARMVYATALGSNAVAASAGGVAIGRNAEVTHAGAVALGANSVTGAVNSVAVGSTNLRRRIMYVAPGTEGNDAVNLDQLNAARRVVDGHTVTLAEQDALLLSHTGSLVANVAQIEEVDNRATLGITNNASAIERITSREDAFRHVFSHEPGEVVVEAAYADPGGSLAIGVGSRAVQSSEGEVSVAVGQQSSAEGLGAALGNVAWAGFKSVAVGSSAHAQNYGVATGYEAQSGIASVAIGWQAQAVGETSVAIGFDAQATMVQSFALGTNAQALGGAAVSLGSGSKTVGKESVALGFESWAGEFRAVALGAQSQAPEVDTVSVGSTTIKRRIVNVADGVADNDVVTIAQLKSSSLWDDDGNALTALTYSNDRSEVALTGINGTRLMNVADGIIAPGSRDAINGGQLDTLRDGLDKRISGLDNRVGTLEGETLATSEAPAGARTLSESSNTATPPAASSTEAPPIASADDVATTTPAAPTAERLTPSRIENVLAGEAPTDAVNLTQLNAQRDEAIKAANIYTDERVESISQDMTSLRNDVQSRFQQVDRRIDRMAAMSGAYAGMAMNTAGLDGVHRMGVGVGSQRGQKAIAVGYQHVIGKRASFSIGGASGGSDRSVNAGAGFSW